MGAYTIEQLNEAKANVTNQTPPKTVALIDKLIAELEDPQWSDLPGNVWPSVKEAGTEAWDALTHPIDTLSNMKDLASGAIRNIPAGGPLMGPFDAMGLTSPEDEQVADAAGEHLYDRWTNPKKTLIEDPAGAALDLTSILTGGAALAPKASMLANLGNKAAGFTDLPGIATKVVRGAGQYMTSPKDIYSSQVKFGTTIPKNKRDKMVQTALDEQILPNQEGLDKLNSTVDASLERVEGSINKATLSGAVIPKEDLLRSVLEYQDSLDPITFGSDYQKVFDQVDDVISKQIELWEGIDMLTPDQVQAFKKELGKKINFEQSAKQFGGNYSPGTEQANVNIQTDARHSLEQLDPNIKIENKRAHDLITLRDKGLERSANRIDNRDAFGLSSMLKVGPGVASGSLLGTAAGLVLDLATRPVRNAKTALAMHQGGKAFDKGVDKIGALGDKNLPEGLMELVRKLPDAAKYLDENGRLTTAGRQLMLEVEKITNEGEQDQIKGVLAQ